VIPVEFYPWLKALHVAAAMAFAGGVLAVAIVLAANEPSRAVIDQVRRWDSWVTTPAMLLVWGLGLSLALTGQWFAHAWLQAKLVLVVALSGLHGVQSGRLRRLAKGDELTPPRFAALALFCIVAIAILATGKPSS
jgi:protoporphyrinogen IX oxidase